MLIELKIRDYAVIEDLSLELQPGLNVLSGETGAGKSIIVGALSLLLGERASSEVVRAGSETAAIEAVFDISGNRDLRSRMEELGIPVEEGLVILKREVAREGRNRAWVNGSPTTVTTVGELGGALVDLHGQHEHQTLLRREEQRAILDDFAGAGELSRQVRGLHRKVDGLRKERESRAERRRELESRSDFLRFQLDEIEEAAVEPGEEEALEREARRLEHAEELLRDAGWVYEYLYGGEEAISDRLAAVRDRLQELVRIDESLEEERSLLEEAYHATVEVGRRLGDFASGVEHDPGRLDEVRQRQDLLFRLKRKYGPELEDVLETRRQAREELEELEGTSLDLEELDREIRQAGEALEEAAEELSAARREAAKGLEKAVGDLLPELGMPGGIFRVDLEPLPEPGPGGAERVEFRVTLNPGFEPRPLSRVASGGELSRVMLALKSILARVDRVPTLVFDEIDAGIGGGVAGRVATKLGKVAELHQVFVITHLPQLASRASQHLYVEKREEGGVASTRVTQLSGDERVREIARMLGGDPESPASRDHARELLHPV